MTFCKQQGEVRVQGVPVIPEDAAPVEIERDRAGRLIISHSEKGHHHVLPAQGVTLMERPSQHEGLRVLYAIVGDPNGVDLTQTADQAHEAMCIPPGVYRLSISREYNPFADEAWRVAD